MKKKWKGLICLAGLCAALCMPLTAMADGHKVVALGADLSPEQINTVLRYFGIQNKSIETIYVTNTDERNHLGSYIPIEQIGSRTISCAYVNPTTSGGIQVKTANMNYVTSRMIASTLSTAGVVNCEVLAAAPFEVSGTGALTGVMMAYENAVGTTLDAERKDIATQELITTEAVAENVGQEVATQIINDIKIQIVEGQVTEPEEVYEIVDDTIYEAVGEVIPDEQIQMLQELAQRIADQEYAYEDMQETLARIDAGVDQIAAAVDDISEQISDSSQTSDTSQEKIEEKADSIFNATDDQAFGTETIIDATSEEAMEGYAEELKEAGIELPEPEPASVPGAEQSPAESPEPAPEQSAEQSPAESPEPAPEQVPEQSAQESPEPAPAVEETPADDGGIIWDDSYSDGNTEDAFTNNEDVTVEEVPAEVDIFSNEEENNENSEDAAVEEAPAEGDIFANEEEYGQEEEAAPDEIEEQAPEEESPAPLEISDTKLVAAGSDESENAAGENVLKYSVSVPGAVIVSGTLDIADENGESVASVDLTGSSRVFTAPMSGEDLTDSMWDAGTTFFILLDKHLANNAVYNVSLSGVVSKEETGETADVNENTQIRTGQFGVYVDLNDIHDLHAGASVSGHLAVDPETAAYAEITDFDGQYVSFEPAAFDIASGENSFTMTLASPGTGSVTIDYFDADGNPLGTYTYNVNVLE